MQASLPTVPTDQNIKSVDLAALDESAKIVGGWQALALGRPASAGSMDDHMQTM
jgi:hypothetical protein